VTADPLSHALQALDPHAHVTRLLAKPANFSAEADLSQDALFDRFDAVFGEALSAADAPKTFVSALFSAKRSVAAWYARTMVSVSVYDAASALEQDETVAALVAMNRHLGSVWSSFADWSLQRACRFAVSQHALSRFFPKSVDDPLEGFFLLGLGKLGGGDLNYSSDVDLIAFFDPDRFTVLPGQGKTDIAARMAKSVTQLLSGHFGDRIWRVDWRLRPDPSVTGLAMATDTGLDFHYFHAAPWRRLAMMKARPVAGDLPCGRSFLKELTPFVWRKTLDYRALDEIAGIKSRIRDEHPGLAEERDDDVPLEKLRGFHLKLGTGGIREIEFVANGLQLVWGGRIAALQTVNTLEALKQLGDVGRLPSADVAFLCGAYCLLRGLENRVQIMADGHVHHVPEDQAGIDLLLALCGTDEATLTRLVSHIRARVHGLFSNLFDDVADTDSTDIVTRAVEMAAKPDLKLASFELGIVKQWRDGFIAHGVAVSTAPRMAPLYDSLVTLVGESDRPDETVRALDSFFRSLPPGGQYLLLLAEHADLAADILEPLTGGGAMGTLLRQSPHVVDTLVQRGGVARTTPEERSALGAFVATQRDYELQLEALRLHVNEMLYLAYLRVWRGRIAPGEARTLLTQLADEALTHAAVLVGENYYPANKGGPPGLSIAGYGKLGMGEMMPLSDLDIVFIAHGAGREDEADIEGAHRFSNRLKTALSTPMRGGVVYEIDTRLRPSGGAGAPTVRLSTLRTHQMERAKTWEHLALVPARIVYGPEFVREDFSEVRADVLSRPRQALHFIRDCHAMLNDLRTHRIRPSEPDRLALKLVPGGLMEAEYLVSVLTIQAAQTHPEIAKMAYRELPQRLEELEYAPKGFAESLRWLQDTHLLERLYGWENRDLSTLPRRQGPAVLLGDGYRDRLDAHCSLISAVVDAIIVKPSGLTGAMLKKRPFEPARWV